MSKKIVAMLLLAMSANANAALELVCEGQGASYGKRAVSVDCDDRRDVVGTLKSAWLTLRQNSIGGDIENMCFEAYMDAKDLHPSIGFRGITHSFFIRCNMGLEYVD
jgi:hypothetical protein